MTIHPAARVGSARITSLDVLRGFALLGIIVMNVQSFSMPVAAYFNPTAYGRLEGANGLAWLASHVLVDQKFMNIFSILFGAGIFLFADRAEARGVKPGRLHYRRTLWLLAFGLVHAYLLWYGDVLTIYALCALVIYPLRRLSPGRLAALGITLFGIGSVIFLAAGATFASWSPAMQDEMRESWAPSEASLAAEVAAYQGSWLDAFAARAHEAMNIHTVYFAGWLFWRVSGLMLLGMALLKWGFLSAERAPREYALVAAAGLGAGIPLIALGVRENWRHGWSVEYSMFFGSQFNAWGALLVAMGYAALVLLVCRTGRLARARGLLANVGRTAFSSYIFQTIAMTTIFYGHGLGLFGQASRTTQIVVALVVIVANVAASTLWLRRFRMGPLEWAWRSLTYWKRQPMTRGPAVEAPAA